MQVIMHNPVQTCLMCFRLCGWCPNDHQLFQFTLPQYTPDIPNHRALCMDMLQRLFPGKTRQELVSTMPFFVGTSCEINLVCPFHCCFFLSIPQNTHMHAHFLGWALTYTCFVLMHTATHPSKKMTPFHNLKQRCSVSPRLPDQCTSVS